MLFFLSYLLTAVAAKVAAAESFPTRTSSPDRATGYIAPAITEAPGLGLELFRRQGGFSTICGYNEGNACKSVLFSGVPDLTESRELKPSLGPALQGVTVDMILHITTLVAVEPLLGLCSMTATLSPSV